MSRLIKDIMDKTTQLKVYPRTHLKAVMIDENTNLEEFIGTDVANRLSTLESSALDKETAKTTYQPIGDYVTKEDSQNYTDTAIANLVDSAPETLNTLNELATAISEHLDVTDALDAAISNKADKSDVEVDIEVEVEVEVEVEDGVYAITADGTFIDYNTADSSCIGVALVAGEHKFMIAKNNATNDGSNYNLYYDYDKGDLSLTNYSNADGTNNYGYLGGSSTPQLSQDFTTWTAGALSDFNGKSNTQIIAASSSNAKDMCKVLEIFNAGSDNQGHSDWYVPAAGQLALMYLAKTDINAALTKIGGTAFNESDFYWSSSECDARFAWYVDFLTGSVGYYDKSHYSTQVRFVRDLTTTTTTTTKKPLKEKVFELEEHVKQLTARIQVVTELPENPDENVLYLIPE